MSLKLFNERILTKFLGNRHIHKHFKRNITNRGERREIIVQSQCTPITIPNQTLPDFVLEHAQTLADKPAVTCGQTGRSYTYGFLDMLTERFAQALIEKCRVNPRDTIALLLPNIPEYAFLTYGALKANVIVTFANPLYTATELRRQFENANVRVIVTFPMLLDTTLEVASGLKNYAVTVCAGGEDDLTRNVMGLESLIRGDLSVTLPVVNPSDVAVLPYSSGTTGLPKGVMLTHRNLVANCAQMDHDVFHFSPKTIETAQETYFNVLPFFHIYGFNGIMNKFLHRNVHLVTLPRFVPEDYIRCLVEYRPQGIFVVPSLLLFLATHPSVTREHLQSIETIFSGAAPVTESLINKIMVKLGKCVRFMQGYGMTESSPVTLLMPKNAPREKLSTAGQLLPNTEVKVVDANGFCATANKPGELLVRGPQIMKGYYKNEKATKETIDDDGWLHTGDVVYYDDDGYFRVIDRTKELIKVKGNQVSPTELENELLDHPAVADVAVVGVPDSVAGEVPRAFIVAKPGVATTEADICAYLHPKVAHYKQLTGGVRFIKQIPRNTTGKILRNELKVSDVKEFS